MSPRAHNIQMKEKLSNFLKDYLDLEAGSPVTMRNVITDLLFVGDLNFKDIRRCLPNSMQSSYIKAMSDGSVSTIYRYLATTRFSKIRKIVLHVGGQQVIRDQIPISTTMLELRSVLALIRARYPECEIYLSYQFPAAFSETNLRSAAIACDLNAQLNNLAVADPNIRIISHRAIWTAITKSLNNGNSWAAGIDLRIEFVRGLVQELGDEGSSD